MATSTLTVTVSGLRGAGKTTLTNIIIQAIKEHKNIAGIQQPAQQAGEQDSFTVHLRK